MNMSLPTDRSCLGSDSNSSSGYPATELLLARETLARCMKDLPVSLVNTLSGSTEQLVIGGQPWNGSFQFVEQCYSSHLAKVICSEQTDKSRPGVAFETRRSETDRDHCWTVASSRLAETVHRLQSDRIPNPQLTTRTNRAIHTQSRSCAPVCIDSAVCQTQDARLSKFCMNQIAVDPDERRSGDQEIRNQQDQTNAVELNLSLVSNTCDPCRFMDIYRCDYCSYTHCDESLVCEHLTQARHVSASLYNSFLNVGGHTDSASECRLISIRKMLAVENPNVAEMRSHPSLVVICPMCTDSFADIFQCGLHTKYEHGEMRGVYSICATEKLKPVVLSTRSLCLACTMTFVNHKALHEHWKAMPLHSPVSIAQTSDDFFIFCCTICRKKFRGNFFHCRMHVIIKHSTQLKFSTTFVVNMLRVSVSNCVRSELLPFADEADPGDRLLNEISVMQATAKHFKQFGLTKSKVKRLRGDVKKMKSLCQSVM